MKIRKSWRMPGTGERPRWVIIDEDDNGKIINKNPSRDELKGVETGSGSDNRGIKGIKMYTDKKLLDDLIQFYKENGKAPTGNDFNGNPGYPSSGIYKIRFGSWNKALKMAELDIDTMAKQGILETTTQKGRLFEIIVREHFENRPKDLSGDNHNSPCDGICPKGKTYDAKSSKLHRGVYWTFSIRNKYRENIEYYYFGAFNSDWTKLEHVWRVPGDIVEKDNFQVGLNNGHKFNVKNMKEYEITDKFKGIFKQFF